jgi:hypothetical protein
VSDFEIEISGEVGSYGVSAHSSAGETGAVSVDFPFDDRGLERRLQALELALLRSSATVRRLASEQERPVAEFGRQLFEFVSPPELRAHLATSRQQAALEGCRYGCGFGLGRRSWPRCLGSSSTTRPETTTFA